MRHCRDSLYGNSSVIHHSKAYNVYLCCKSFCCAEMVNCGAKISDFSVEIGYSSTEIIKSDFHSFQ